VRITLDRLPRKERASVRHNQTALAIVALLIGGLLCVSSILQHVTLFGVIAESVTPSDPLLNADQTVLLGMGFLLSACVALVHPFRRSPHRRQKGAASAT
jgi:hypothetical protein